MAKKIKPPRDPKAEKAERKAEKAAALAESKTATAEEEAQKAEEDAAAAAAAQDEFQARGVELADHVHDHPGKVLAILGSIVLAGLLYGVYTVVDKSNNTKASAAYAEAMKIWEAPIKADDADSADKPAAGQGPSFKNANERAKAAEEKFVALATEHRGTGAGALAWLSAGHAALKLGDNEAAAKNYDSFLFAAKDNDPLRFAGYAGRAAALEGKGDVQGAIDAYEKLVLLADKVGEDDALLQLGRLYQKQGDVEKARKRLERLKSDFPESALKARADEILATLGAAPAAAGVDGTGGASGAAKPAAQPAAPAGDAK